MIANLCVRLLFPCPVMPLLDKKMKTVWFSSRHSVSGTQIKSRFSEGNYDRKKTKIEYDWDKHDVYFQLFVLNLVLFPSIISQTAMKCNALFPFHCLYIQCIWYEWYISTSSNSPDKCLCSSDCASVMSFSCFRSNGYFKMRWMGLMR